MKIRIQGNSIRFRLKEGEVKEFLQHAKIVERLEFAPIPDFQLSFTLAISMQKEISISFEENDIAVSIPIAIAKDWSHHEKLEFETLVDTGKGREIRLSVEKESTCKHEGREFKQETNAAQTVAAAEKLS